MWVVPGLYVSPFCSEPGAVSASQDTCLQSACKGGLRPGPLCPLPCPGLVRPTFRPTYSGSSLWTQLTRQLGSSGYNWMDPYPSRLIPML